MATLSSDVPVHCKHLRVRLLRAIRSKVCDQQLQGVMIPERCRRPSAPPVVADDNVTSRPPLIPETTDSWRWSRADSSASVLVSDDGDVILFHPTTALCSAAARGAKMVNNGRFYWELQLGARVFGTAVMFGVATRAARLEATEYKPLIGEDHNSWGLSHKGTVWHGGLWAPYTHPFRENVPTTVGVLFDGLAGTLGFFKDGVWLGVAFTGLSTVKEPLFPIVSSTTQRTEMKLICTRSDLGTLAERSCAVLLRGVQPAGGPWFEPSKRNAKSNINLVRKKLGRLGLPQTILDAIEERTVIPTRLKSWHPAYNLPF